MGGRSRVAAQMMAGQGFENLYNVSGGIKAWQSGTAVGPQDLGVHLFSGKEGPEEVLKAAFSLEQGLQAFYRDMAGQAKNPGVASLFDKLSRIEVKHQESIVAAYRGLGHPDITLDAFSTMVNDIAMEGGMTTQEYLDLYQPDLGDPRDILGLAMAIEAQALDLYLRVRDQLAHAPAKEIVLKIADEEKAHLASLGQLMAHL